MTGKKMTFLAAATVIAGCLIWLGWKMTSRGAYESAEYTVVETDGSFEIREYPDLMLVTTSMQSASQGDDGSFMRLFRYISGGNEDQQKVAMTTPVFMEPENTEGGGKMGFVIPRQVAEQHVPEPANENVQLQKRSAGRFAVIRFAGRISDVTLQGKKRELQDWLEKKRLQADGAAELAGYDPPWTPGPFRRNELLLRLKSDRQSTTGRQP
jgi:hypothetical protein